MKNYVDKLIEVRAKSSTEFGNLPSKMLVLIYIENKWRVKEVKEWNL